MEICKALKISTESLVVNGEIVPIENAPKSHPRTFQKRLEAYVWHMQRRARLREYSIDNIPLSEDEMKDFSAGMEVLIELIRKKRRDSNK
jgi:hypothetical protein